MRTRKFKIIPRPKAFFVLAILLATLLAGGGMVYALFSGGSVNLQKGLVGHWKMDGNAKDATPYASNGTLAGDAAVTDSDRKGQANKALVLDGVDDGMVVADPTDGHLDFGTGDFSVSFWLKGTDDSGSLLGKKGDHTFTAQVGWGIYARSTDPYISFIVSDGTDGKTTAVGEMSTSPWDGNWHHIVLTWNGSTDANTIWLDTVSQGAGTGTSGGGGAVDSTSNATDFKISDIPSGGTNADWAGSIDDVRIYNRAISVAEVTALYESYNPGIVVSDLQKGLVGQWKMDGNAKDATPYSAHGTVTAATLATDRKAQSNNAYDLNGTTAYISIPDNSRFTIPAGFTYSIWVNTSTTAANSVFMAKYKDTATTARETYLGYQGAANRRIQWFVYDNTAGVCIGGNTSTDVMSLGEWHHIVATYDGGTTNSSLKLYMDGVSVTLNAGCSGSFTTIRDLSEPLTIGAGNTTGTPAYFLDGVLDDARIYNRVLSQAEITALYESYNPGIAVSDLQKGLVGYWKLDGTAQDASPNNYDGTLVGPVSASDRKGQSGKAYQFVSSETDYITMGDVINFERTDPFSLSFWIKRSSAGTTQIPFAKKDSTAPVAGWMIRITTISKLEFIISHEAGNEAYISTSSTFTSTSDWYHIVATYNGSSLAAGMKIYVNGVAQATSTVTNNLSDTIITASSLNIGARDDGATPFNGLVDDARIYNRELSSGEVTALYDSYR